MGDMFTPLALSLFVLAVVVLAIFVREVTQYTPDSPARLWATRAAVFTISAWLVLGLIRQTERSRSMFDLFASRGFSRGLLSILLIMGGVS